MELIKGKRTWFLTQTTMARDSRHCHQRKSCVGGKMKVLGLAEDRGNTYLGRPRVVRSVECERKWWEWAGWAKRPRGAHGSGLNLKTRHHHMRHDRHAHTHGRSAGLRCSGQGRLACLDWYEFKVPQKPCCYPVRQNYNLNELSQYRVHPRPSIPHTRTHSDTLRHLVGSSPH